jgi:rhodanese-related sulfurtransferase
LTRNGETSIRITGQIGAILVIATLLGFLVNQFRPSPLPLDSVWSPAARLATTSGESLLVPLEEAKEHFFNQTAVFLDARSPDSYGEGHIEGAISLPFDRLEERFIDVAMRIPPEILIITYCDVENCSLSDKLARFLIEDGFSNVKVLVNGWTVWNYHRLPIETGMAS